MELPQPRPFGTEGRKTTHDFLSLYSPAQQDQIPPHGSLLKTRDFFQLDHVVKNVPKEEDRVGIKEVDKSPPVAPPPTAEHLLPGGIGTYSITYFNQRVPKPEGNLFLMAQACSANGNDENCNSSSYTGSGFTPWDETAAKKGKTRKENDAGTTPILQEAGVNMGRGPWTSSSERPSQSSSNHQQNTTTFSSLSSSQPSPAQINHSFMNMITSAKSVQEEDDDDEEEDFVIKMSQPKVKMDGKSTDQKPNTPRSKHSATEQRRRSKINDRFQKLREIIPHSDQKRDKASFLLEVIEYIQFLQEKVHKYEGTYQGWNQEPSKLIPWRKHSTPEDFINQTHSRCMGSGPASMGAAKIDESEKRTSAASFRERAHQPELVNKAASVQLPLQPRIFPFCGVSSTVLPVSSRPASDIDKTESQLQPHLWPSGCYSAETSVKEKMKDRELAIESGTISISSIYSQGLLNTLTQALQSSGIDLSQANLSVQIDLGKRANGRVNSSASILKDIDHPTISQALPRSVVTSTADDSGQALKRYKTSRR